jgi:hypothetical protein
MIIHGTAACGRLTQRSGMVVAAQVLVGVSVLIGGCGSRDPHQPLTPDEGSKLLREVHSDPSRVPDLSPAEKQYLKQRLAK